MKRVNLSEIVKILLFSFVVICFIEYVWRFFSYIYFHLIFEEGIENWRLLCVACVSVEVRKKMSKYSNSFPFNLSIGSVENWSRTELVFWHSKVVSKRRRRRKKVECGGKNVLKLKINNNFRKGHQYKILKILYNETQLHFNHVHFSMNINIIKRKWQKKNVSKIFTISNILTPPETSHKSNKTTQTVEKSGEKVGELSGNCHHKSMTKKFFDLQKYSRWKLLKQFSIV